MLRALLRVSVHLTTLLCSIFYELLSLQKPRDVNPA